ncbi:MAG: transposase family protein [Nitrospira sp.]|nr:transposase family protein [Nitrospira sp.]
MAVPRVDLPKPTQPGRCYAMDFVHDRLVMGHRFNCLTMTDLYSREVLLIELDVSIGGPRVCRILDRLFNARPLPDTVILDNSPEFSGTALDTWVAQQCCISFNRVNRFKMHLSKALMASFGMNV